VILKIKSRFDFQNSYHVTIIVIVMSLIVLRLTTAVDVNVNTTCNVRYNL